MAVYEAKARGRSRVVLFDADLQRWIDERGEWERDLRHGIANGELTLHYQPIMDLSSDTWCAGIGPVTDCWPRANLYRWPRNRCSSWSDWLRVWSGVPLRPPLARARVGSTVVRRQSGGAERPRT